SNKSDNRSSNEVNPNTGVQYHGNILGTGFLKPDAVDVIIAYIKSQNPSVNIKTAKDLINTYFKEAKVEEVNPDIAIAQMLYATDNLRNERMRTHNYAGLSTEGVRWGGSFSTMSQGVRAHIQHLKGYASIKPLNGYTEDDPRFKLLNDLGYRGRATTFDQLFKFWAPYSPDYRNKINRILKDLYRFV
ncbi:MAG: glucosaminidase domain-containing protein, partial [Treponema sp.]|nr:glucosaminidase domain-containing protein [Treponema sp.]